MPIDLRNSAPYKKPSKDEQDRKIEEYFQKKEEVEQPMEEFDEEIQEQEFPLEDIGEIIYQWEVPEFETYERSGQWYAVFGIFMLVMVVYALVTNSPLMAITFILLGLVGYIYLQKDPRIITFRITTMGIVADKEMYPYENIKSFWIFYNPPHEKILSLHTTASMLPYVHIPIADQDPVVLREKLLPYVQEKKQNPSLINTLERIFRI